MGITTVAQDIYAGVKLFIAAALRVWSGGLDHFSERSDDPDRIKQLKRTAGSFKSLRRPGFSPHSFF